jgi:hypothetical protein
MVCYPSAVAMSSSWHCSRVLFAGVLLVGLHGVHGLVPKPSKPTDILGVANQFEIDGDDDDGEDLTGERQLSLLNTLDANAERTSDIFDVLQSYWQKVAAFFGVEQDVQQCPQLSLNPDTEALALRMKQGPVFAEAKAFEAASAPGPHHVFISGPAHGGTTAMYNLVGTSPLASNICRAKTTCCEGSWLLLKRGLMEYKKRFFPEYPRDWNDALKVFSEYWNTSKKVLIEKSPESLSKFTHIYRDLNATGKRVSFIYVTRSPCYPPEAHIKFAPRMHELTHQIDELKALGARVLVVRMEDLEHDPYATAREVLEFVPELQSLDPTVNSIDSEQVKFEGGERAIPIAQFVASRDFTYGRRHGKIVHSNAEDRRLMRKLGYPETLVQQ